MSDAFRFIKGQPVRMTEDGQRAFSLKERWDGHVAANPRQGRHIAVRRTGRKTVEYYHHTLWEPI